MQFLQYPPYKGYINRWMLSTSMTEELDLKPVEFPHDSVGDTNNGSPALESPAVTAAVAERRRAGAPIIQKTQIYPGAPVSWGGDEQKLYPYFPFGDVCVDLSSTWDMPCHISAYAYTILVSKQDQAIPVELATCGGLTIWVNGKKCLELTPFTRNIPASKTVTLSLEEGPNRVEVWFGDIAWRDTRFFFSMRCFTGDSLTQQIPIGSCDPNTILRVEHAMETLSFSRNHYTDGDVMLRCENPYYDIPFEVAVDFDREAQRNGQARRPFQCKAVFEPFKNRAVLAKCGDLPSGFLRFSGKAEVFGIHITRRLVVEIYHASSMPETEKEISGRKRQVLEYLSANASDDTVRALALLYRGGYEDAGEILYRQPSRIQERDEPDIINLLLLIHVLWRYGKSKALPEAVKQALKTCVLSFRYWDGGQDNDSAQPYNSSYALALHSCRLLAGELYPGENFTGSGMTGRELGIKGAALLERWFDRYFRENPVEWNSASSISVIAMGFSCVYAGTKNQNLRGKAKQGLDSLFFRIAVYGKDGYFSSASGRAYLRDVLGNYSNRVSMISYIGYGKGNLCYDGTGALPLCFSDYEPPREYQDYLDIPPGSELIRQSTEGEQTNLYLYKTAGFALSSAADFRPGLSGSYIHPVHLIFSPVVQIWVNHPGEPSNCGKGEPSYWTGNGSLPRVNQYKGFAFMAFDIPEKHLANYTHLYLPTMEFYICRMQGNWIMGVYRNNYCAVYAANGLEVTVTGPDTDREFISYGYRNLWLIRVAAPEEFTDFDTFAEKMKGNPPVINMEDLEFIQNDPVYGVLSGGWNKRLCVSGEEMRYSGYGSAGVTSLKKIVNKI